ncbi:MAG: DUF4412 domain-containing protein [Bacteroidia bacterium]|nr:DUF4412 domain-containing protein [Bacteroidia bacterium]
MKWHQGKKAWILFFILPVFNIYSQPQREEAAQQAIKNKPFEGSIYFVQETLTDTSYYTYYVKGRKVRLDIHSDCNNCEEFENRLLFDLDAGTITALQPRRKLYMNITVRPYISVPDNNYEINQTKNYKMILGYKCYQWRVKNKSQNTEIAYWVANDNFNFFHDFLKLWNRAEKHAVYYLKIPESDGYFPLLSEERSTLREKKMRLNVIRINKTELDKKMFEIPLDYHPYDR